MAYTQIGALIDFTAGTTIVSADVDSNFSDIRDVVNGLVTGSNTIEADTINEVTAANGVSVDGVTLKDGGITTTGAASLGGAVNVTTANGIDVNPGSDIDADLITVGVTSSPKMYWDESETAFRFNTAVIVDSTLRPDADDGAALGTGSLAFSDLFLASGGVLNFANGDITITHAANKITVAGGTMAINGNFAHEDAGGTVGFYGATPIAQQTGVINDIDAVHAALVNLGLISS